MLTVDSNKLVLVTRKCASFAGILFVFIYKYNMEQGDCYRNMKYDNILYLLYGVGDNPLKALVFASILQVFQWEKSCLGQELLPEKGLIGCERFMKSLDTLQQY